MIRVLHIVTYMGRGGLETMIMNYYRHIDRNNVQFDFLVHRDFEADYDKEIQTLGGRIYHVSRLIPWSKSYRGELKKFFREHSEYRIVHVHQDCLSAVALQCARECGVPVRIAHSHSSSQDKNLKYLIKLYYRKRIPIYATELFACGSQAGEWMFRGAPYQIIHNAVEAERYAFSEARRARMRIDLQIAPDAFVVGHVGRFNTVKNHHFLLNVFSQVKKLRSGAVLLLVGDGPLRPQIEAEAEALGLKHSVMFTGVRSDVPDLLQAMDVFAFPSLYEGFPVTLIEAQAAGLPCLISDSIPDECDITKLIVRLSLRTTVSEWADTLLRLCKLKRENMSKLIEAAGFDIIRNAQWLENYYQEQWKATN